MRGLREYLWSCPRLYLVLQPAIYCLLELQGTPCPFVIERMLYCLSYFYFTPAWNFIWHAKCSVGLLVGQNILPWLCKTVTLSSFICSVCLGWLRRWSLEVIYGLRVGHRVCGSRFSIHKEFQVLVNTQYFPNPIGSLWIWSNRLNSLSICLW